MGDLERVQTVMHALGERAEDLREVLDAGGMAAIDADVAAIVAISERFAAEAAPIAERLDAAATAALGPGWMREQEPVGATRSAGRRRYLARGQ